MTKRPTIRDVARLAGVSHQTVSRVINAKGEVAPETRRRVETAIEELHYRPSAIARSMARGRSQTLACIAPNLTDYTFASLIAGAEHEARRQGYFLLSTSAADEAEFVALIPQVVSDWRTDGLLIINPYADGRHARLPENLPSVFVGARPRQEAVDSVALDDEAAARQAVQHLLACGHHRIAVLHGPLAEDCVQDRLAGYQAALAQAGLPADPALVLAGDWSASTAYHSMQYVLQQQSEFTALFAQNDRMAMGAIRALREAGRQVPGDVSVIGFDDMPLTAYFDPPLTTMRQDMESIGAQAARLLIHAIDDPHAARQHLRVPAELIIRQSTQPLR